MTQQQPFDDYSFDGQRDDEEIIALYRHDIVYILKFILVALGLVLAGVGLIIAFDHQVVDYIGWGLIGLGLIVVLIKSIPWYFTMYIITNQRLRYINQRGFFRRTITDIDLDSIRNITYDTPGFLADILGFGNIVVRTDSGALTMPTIADADTAYNQLQDLTITKDNNDENI